MASFNLRELFPDLADLTEEQIIMIQETAFNDMRRNKDRSMGLSGGGGGGSGGRGGGWTSVQEFDSHVAADEAFARALERGEDVSGYEITGYRTTTEEIRESSLDNNPGMDEDEALALALSASRLDSGQTGGSLAHGGDNIDPDNMSYEELTNLGDSVGKESKGLPVETISQLPSFTHKAGGEGGAATGGRGTRRSSSSKKKVEKDEKDECIICRTEFEDGDKMTALPCAHRFHTDCITPWLKDNKQCPICQKEPE